MHIHDKGHSDPACGAQMSRKNCDMSGTCQPPSSCSRAYVTRLGPNKSRSHVTRRLIGTLTIAFWASSTQSTLVADTPLIYTGRGWYFSLCGYLLMCMYIIKWLCRADRRGWRGSSVV